jgi:hypothetical protein
MFGAAIKERLGKELQEKLNKYKWLYAGTGVCVWYDTEATFSQIRISGNMKNWAYIFQILGRCVILNRD